MSASDYLAIKKRKNGIPLSCASDRTKNKQFLTIQTTPLINEDGEFIQGVERFSIPLSNHDYAVLSYPSYIKPVFTIPRIRTNEYIKKRYQLPFCWNCYIPIDLDNVITNFGCSACETIHSLQSPVQSLLENIEM